MFNVDDVFTIFEFSEGETNEHFKFDKHFIEHICDSTLEILKDEPTLLELSAPIRIIGDIHGQLTDLIRYLRFEDNLNNFQNQYLFLGDYVDRGINSVSCLVLLFALKLKYPKNFFLLRGNHETEEISRNYGFYDECLEFYDSSLFSKFNYVFQYFPLAATISNQFFCVHGGFSQNLFNLSQISAIQKPVIVPESGLVSDLLWADPNPEVLEFSISERGTSFYFGEKVVKTFLKNNSLNYLIRAHQAVDDGYEYAFYPEKHTITIFSATDYYDDTGNDGSMMIIDPNLNFKFVIIESKIKSNK